MKCEVKNEINSIGFVLTPETSEEHNLCTALSGCFFLGHWSQGDPGFWMVPEHRIREEDRNIERQIKRTYENTEQWEDE